MTDLMDSANPGGGPFFIWDRELAKFVRTDQASEDQIRLYGGSQYTSFGSGRSRVMTPIDPRGAATSYAVTESTRRGELVPAGRAAGRAGLPERRGAEAAERQATLEERRRKIEKLEVDVNAESLWQTMDLYTKQLLYSDPSLLEGVPLRGVDIATVMDYVFFGTPRSPGLFMDGVSNEYVFVRVGGVGRFKNAMFASEEERMNSKIYTREDVERAGQIPTFEPLGETFEREFPFIVKPAQAAAKGVAEAAKAAGRVAERALPGWFGSEGAFDDIEGFPDGAFTVTRRVTPQMGVEQVKIANADVLGPWIRSNYELLSPAQKRKIEDLVEDARASYDEDISSTLSPEEQRVVRGRGLNPWDAIDNRTREMRADAAVPEAERLQRAAVSEQEGRRFAGRYGAEMVQAEETAEVVAKRQFMNSLASNVEQRIQNRYANYTFVSQPLGFAADELVTVSSVSPLNERLGEINQLVRGGMTPDQQAVAAALGAQDAPDLLAFRTGANGVPMVTYTPREQQEIAQGQAFTRSRGRGQLLTDSEREEAEGRGRALQASATRSFMTEGKKPLTQGQARLLLRDISRNPSKMAKIKQQLVAVGADPDNYISDTSMDATTINAWESAVAQANNAGMDPEVYLAQLQLDPTARNKASSRGPGPGPAFTIRLPSSDDVATIVQDVSQRRIGQRLDSEQAKQIAEAYVSMAESQYRSQQGASTVTDPMSAETFAQQQISSQFGSDEMVYQTGLQLDTLISMIGG